MNVKLSALALGITLAYGMTAAMAADAYIEQTGSFNVGAIDQYDNDGSEVEASIVASGNGNVSSIDQSRSNRIWADINASGNGNVASVTQRNVDYAGATVYQAASGGTVSIDQGNYGWGDGSSQWAHVYQNAGWGNDADITQRGDKVKTVITQEGQFNTAKAEQYGSGRDFNEAYITQDGTAQFASVKQSGRDLTANVTQTGLGNVAMVEMRGNGHTATVVQNGWANIARVNQRN